jgi:hypothetical protein
MSLFHSMRADARQRVGGAPDLSPLLGTWINVNPQTECIVKLVATENGDGLRVHAYGAGFPEPIDWGEVEATPYVAGGTTEGGGFLARYDLGAVETVLVTNQKLGVLVIQSYTRFKDGSGRLGYFAREFFRAARRTDQGA